MVHQAILNEFFGWCYSIDFDTTNNINVLNKINSYAKIYH